MTGLVFHWFYLLLAGNPVPPGCCKGIHCQSSVEYFGLWKYNKKNLFAISDEGYRKEGRELEGFNCVKGAAGAGKGEMQ